MLRKFAAGLLLILTFSCGAEAPPPSILLFVIDTTRADDPALGDSRLETTPYWQRLGEEGLVYTRSISQAPWTLPAHASMLTGLLPSQHGVGWVSTRAEDALVTVTERLAEAGYETLAVAENPWLTPTFNLLQGFDQNFFIRQKGLTAEEAVAEWLENRPAGAPFFVFVNVVDPHAPYQGHEACRLPDRLALDEARALNPGTHPELCVPADPAELEVMRTLHQCDLTLADEKLRRIHGLLLEQAPELVSIVTSDHGEHFGEHQLMSHQFSVRNELLAVPLVVHGLAGIDPARIDAWVGTSDLAPSILEWAGASPLPGQEGRTLPTRPVEGRGRAVVSEYADYVSLEASTGMGRRLLAAGRGLRSDCGPDQPVFGSMRSVIRYPHKAIQYSEYDAELFDLSKDPGETRNIAEANRSLLEELLALLPEAGRVPNPSPELPSEPTGEILESLEALGYLEADEPASSEGKGEK